MINVFGEKETQSVTNVYMFITLEADLTDAKYTIYEKIGSSDTETKF